MRKNIGWQERTDDAKADIRVLFQGGDRILWRRKTKAMDRWEPFDPTPEHWALLAEKTRNRYVRRQAPYKDLQLIERLAAHACSDTARRPATSSPSRPPRPCLPAVALAQAGGVGESGPTNPP